MQFHFFKAAKFRATEVQPRCTIFFEGEWNNANVYDYCVIMVESHHWQPRHAHIFVFSFTPVRGRVKKISPLCEAGAETVIKIRPQEMRDNSQLMRSVNLHASAKL
jgi:hypothetical protein